MPTLAITNQMGVISDSFKATLEAIKQQDEISRQQTQQTLERIGKLIEELKAMDLDWKLQQTRGPIGPPFFIFN